MHLMLIDKPDRFKSKDEIDARIKKIKKINSML